MVRGAAVLVLLPPSETKREGGTGGPVDLATLSWPGQLRARREVTRALAALGRNKDECVRVLKLSPKQLDEVQRNRSVLKSPTMPAIDRYTGVIFDALDALSLPAAGRNFLRDHVAISSAAFGLVRALDMIPAYRLSFDSRLAGLKAGSLKHTWAAAGSAALAGVEDFILDARSEGYAALAPLPPGANATYLRVVTRGEGGAIRALNHFNKKGKGEFVRALALDGRAAGKIRSTEDLIAWGHAHGWVLAPGAPGETNLFVSGEV
jgi:cytoplasmic iron level regulating protein YaaA (DUF328/UPF0246 family)